MDQDSSGPIRGEEVIYITSADLPLSCPMPQTRLWDSHPRIYLPIENTKHMVCPYCNTSYHLLEETCASSNSKQSD